jgi:hypothetical protein
MKSAMSTIGTRSREGTDAGRDCSGDSVDIGLAFLQVIENFLQALPFRWVHVCELDAKVLTSRPGHSGPTYMDGFLMCRNVHTERDRCTDLYDNSAFNGGASQGKVKKFSFAKALISLERNRILHLHPPFSPLLHRHAPLDEHLGSRRIL